MDVVIRSRGFTLTAALRDYAERRLQFALDRHEDRIARAVVVLEDLNGPRGGDDKACRVELRLRSGRRVRTTVVDADAYVALAAAADRAAHALGRALARERATTLELLWLARTMARRDAPA